MCRLALLYISLVPFGQRLINCCTVMTMSSWESLWLGLAITCSNNTYTTLPPRSYPTLYPTFPPYSGPKGRSNPTHTCTNSSYTKINSIASILGMRWFWNGSHRRAQDWRQTRRNQLVPQSALWLSSIVFGKEHTIYYEAGINWPNSSRQNRNNT